MAVTSREDLKAYCLRELGAPLVDVNLTVEQIDDRVDQAILFFQEYYWDGITREYFKHQVTQQDFDQRYISIPDSIWAVTKVFPTSSAANPSMSIFDLQYQLRMNDLRDLTSTSVQYYAQVMSHMALLDNMLNTQRQFRFNRLQGKLFLDLDWKAKIPVGQFIVVEAYAALDPAQSPKMWDDRHFKEYTTALLKKQWGTNLKKFQGISLPGGVKIDGQSIYNEGKAEVEEIEKELIDNLAPLSFEIG